MRRLSLSAIAILGLFVSGCAQGQTSTPLSQPGQRSLPHAVPTNLPDVYAFTQPPTGFDPLTASKEDLELWGYPPRPDVSEGPKALARWYEGVNPTLRRSVPELVRRPDLYNREVMKLKVESKEKNTTAASSLNWSGYGLTAASGGKAFYKVTGRWTVPTVTQGPNTCSGGWDYSSQWVGIGGFADSYLLQSGSAADVFCDIGGNVPEYFPWLEWLPESELVIYKDASTETLYPFAPGDYLIVTVWATDFSSGVSKTGNLSFADVTQNWSVSLTFSAASVGGSEVTGQSVEWIVERTEVDGSLSTLPDYVANPWLDAGATDLAAVAYAPGTPHTATAYNITMLDNSSNPVSFVDLFGTDALWFFPEGSAVK
jgi:hypothetical protein